jgi:polysaccharide export outer membrane protein
MRKIALFLISLIIVWGCTPTSKLKYTVDTDDSKDKFHNDRSEKTIQPYDYLYIRLYSLDQTTSSIFNGEMQYGMMNESLQSYEVNGDGYISFPFIGNLLVKDLTIDEAQAKLETELNRYLTNISLRVRFVGNKITIIGEVNHPGNYTFYDEKITVFQALGLAGDIANYGNKTKVTLLREIDNTIAYHYLDLTDKKIVESEYYYLLPNDILIVDPIAAKYRTIQDRSIPYLILSTLGTLAATASVIIQAYK